MLELTGDAGEEATMAALEYKRKHQHLMARRHIEARRRHALAPKHERYVKVQFSVAAGKSFNDVIRTKSSNVEEERGDWNTPIGVRFEALPEDAARSMLIGAVSPVRSTASNKKAPAHSNHDMLYPCDPASMHPLSEKALKAMKAIFRTFASFPLQPYAA